MKCITRKLGKTILYSKIVMLKVCVNLSNFMAGLAFLLVGRNLAIKTSENSSQVTGGKLGDLSIRKLWYHYFARLRSRYAVRSGVFH